MRKFDFYDIIITIVCVAFISAVIGLIGYIAYQDYHNPCVEWEETEGFSCHGYKYHMNCSKEKVCVRRQNDK